MDVLRQPIAEELAAWESFKAAGLGVDAIKAQLVRPPKRDMGDVALGCFVFAKNAGIKPNEMALKLAAGSSQLAVREQQTANREPRIIESATAAGPYVNFKLSRAACIGRVLSEIERTCPGNSIDDAPLWSFGASEEGRGKTLVLDFSSPNIAKPLAVHHLRSTMIGYAIKKIRESQSWRVVGINHLGDWGTGFGKLIAGMKEQFPSLFTGQDPSSRKKLESLSIAEINAAYQAASAATDDSSKLASKGKQEFAELERLARERDDKLRLFDQLRELAEKDFSSLSSAQIAPLGVPELQTAAVVGSAAFLAVLPQLKDQWLWNWLEDQCVHMTNFGVWTIVRHLSLREFERVYRALGLSFRNMVAISKSPRELTAEELRQDGLYFGESECALIERMYPDFVPNCRTWRIAEESDGAFVMFTHGRKRPPLMLQKNDGATTYALRDLTAAKYRVSTWGHAPDPAGDPRKLGPAIPIQLAYVVGGEQKLHFEQLFAALQMYEDADPKSPSPKFDWKGNCTHVEFGLLLFKQPDGKWAKASTRAGRTIMLEHLLDESVDAVRGIIKEKNADLAQDAQQAERVAQAVGVGAVIFNDLKNGRRNDIKFDWDEILNFTGETGPYMLMQFVRMGSVTEKFHEAAQQKAWGAHSWQQGDAAKLARDDEWELALLLANFPEALRRASAEYEPSLAARQLIDIAAQTSSWWTNTKDTRIVGEDAELSKARVRLVNAVRKVLGRGLLLLGMTLVERM
jgi:arginyl-tRNA synthetase